VALSRPFLKTLAAVAMLALVAVACGGGGGKKTAAKGTTTSIEDTNTTVADTSTTAAAGGATGTATTKPGQKPSTAAGPKVNGQPANNYTPPAGATPAKPAAPGTYTEDNSGTSTFGAPPPKSPLVIDPPAGTRQHSTSDMRSAGKGSVSETTLDYQPDGVHLVEVKVTTFNQTLDFVGNPPPLAAPTGVKPGQSVDFDLSSNPPGTNIHVHIDFVRNETITIGGQPVNTMFIHQVGTLSGNINGTQTMDAWVSTQYDLFVKTHSTSDATASGVHFTSDVTSTLEKLTPG
jgi:hypothetical protein